MYKKLKVTFARALPLPLPLPLSPPPPPPLSPSPPPSPFPSPFHSPSPSPLPSVIRLPPLEEGEERNLRAGEVYIPEQEGGATTVTTVHKSG